MVVHRSAGKGAAKVYYDPRNLPLRNLPDIEDTFVRLASARNNAERDRIGRHTGIKGRSLLFSIPCMRPYDCFPVDIMHLFYSVQGRLLELHLGDDEEEFALSEAQIRTLDQELVSFRDDISGQLAPKTRPLSVATSWKAKARKDFTLL